MVPEVNEEFVLGKCDFFASTQVWPINSKLDPESWLGNFDDEDRHVAVQLLNAFVFYSDDLLDRSFVSAVQGLSRLVTTFPSSLKSRRNDWFCFLQDTVFTFPTGEIPFQGDSGRLFVRRVRDLLGVEEERGLSPESALQALDAGEATSVIFVDDFAGTGQQFRKTWKRDYSGTSFHQLWHSRSFEGGKPFRAFYCPVFCTEYAMNNELGALSAEVTLSPANWLNDRHSLLHEKSVWWPEHLRTAGNDLIRKYSTRLSLPDTAGKVERDWQGFHCLGLALAFRHSLPDATIPLFDTTVNGWRPLWKQ